MEQRSIYTAYSSDEQPQKTVLCSPDIVLLVPMFQSVQADTDDPCAPCLHLIRLPDTHLGLCNVLTEQRCACCHCPMCEQHQAGQSMQYEKHSAPLCATCALLPVEMRYVLYTFWRAINCQQEREEEAGYVDQ